MVLIIRTSHRGPWQWCKAVRCAWRVETMLAEVILISVNTNDVGRNVVTLCRGGDNDLLGAGLDVLACAGSIKKDTSSSMTMSMPISFQGVERSRSDTTLMGFPFTVIVASSTTLTSASKVPRMESYLSKCARVGSTRLLTHTTSGGVCPAGHPKRTKLRPGPFKRSSSVKPYNPRTQDIELHDAVLAIER